MVTPFEGDLQIHPGTQNPVLVSLGLFILVNTTLPMFYAFISCFTYVYLPLIILLLFSFLCIIHNHYMYYII